MSVRLPKAIDVLGGFKAAEAPLSSEEAVELQSRLESAIVELEQADAQFDEYTTLQDEARIDILRAQLRASLILITNFLETGDWDPQSSLPSSNQTNQFNPEDSSVFQEWASWEPGIHGDFQSENNNLKDKNRFASQHPDWEYLETIYADESAASPMIVDKVMSDAIRVEYMNSGSDIIGLYSLADGTTQFRVFKSLAEKINVSFTSDASSVTRKTNSQTGEDLRLTIDASRVYRRGTEGSALNKEPAYGMIIHGSHFNDQIIGSQNKDLIWGGDGDDMIDAQAGDDEVYGDESPTSEIVFGSAEGNDELIGGIGTDTLDGGGGLNTGFDGDKGEVLIQMHQMSDRSTKAGNVDKEILFLSNDWEMLEDANSLRNGEMSVERKTDVNGSSEMVINMPPWAEMAYAENAPELEGGITITFVGYDRLGEPKFFKLNVKGFYDVDPVIITVNGRDAENAGEIIDFSRIANLGNNVININGMSGDDMILGAQNALALDGLNPSNMFEQSTEGSEELKSFKDEIVRDTIKHTEYPDPVDPLITNDPNKDLAIRATEQGRVIVVEKVRKDPNDPTQTTVVAEKIESYEVSLASLEGYEKAYYRIVNGENGTKDAIVVMVDPAQGSTPARRIVIRIKNVEQDFSLLANKPSDEQNAAGAEEVPEAPKVKSRISIIQLDSRSFGNKLDGGQGDDIIYGTFSDDMSSNVDNGEDILVQGAYHPDATEG